MRGDKLPNARDIGQPVRRLRLVRTPDRGEEQKQQTVDYARKSLDAPLTITPPKLNVSGGDEGGYPARTTPRATPVSTTTTRSVKKINTLTPPHTRTTRGRTGSADTGAISWEERSAGSEAISHKRKALRESRDQSRKSHQEKVYRRRRVLAIGLGSGIFVVIGLVALIIAFGPAGGGERVAINPEAAPDAVIAEVGNIALTTPVRPEALNGLGYHAEGEEFSEIVPRGRNLGSLLSFLPFGSTPENLGYFVMDGAGRGGPVTGAVDVGAEAGAEVFSPVTGLVTSIRPDPKITGASVVEIQPTDNTDLRVYVTLVESEDGSAGVKSPVEAGETSLGSVVDSASVLEPQLAGYTGKDGNHVTIFTSSVD